MNKLLFLLIYSISTVVFTQTLNYSFKSLNKIPNKIEAYTFSGKDIDENDANIKSRKHIYYLNKKGNFLRQESYKKNGNLSYWLAYKYNKTDDLIKVTFRNADSTLNYINNYRYDDLGRLKKSVAYTYSDTLIVDYTYWQKEDILIRSKVMRKSGDSSLVFLDSNNNTIKSVYTLEGNLNGYVDNEYDKYNNLIKTIKVNQKNDILLQIESDYDEFGNFIKKRFYSINNEEKILEDTVIQLITYDKFNNPLKKYQRNINTGYVYIELFKYFY